MQDDGAKKEMRRPDVDCMPMPPQRYIYQLSFKFAIGDRVTMKGVDFTGIVTSAFVGPSYAISYWVDNGKDEKCINGDLLQFEYEWHTQQPFPFDGQQKQPMTKES